MKEYCAFPGIEEEGNKLLVRNRGTKLVPISHHQKTGNGSWSWGNENQHQDIVRSLVFDTFGINTCRTYPNECKCRDSTWGKKIGLTKDFDYQELYNSIEDKFLRGKGSKDQFTINHLELCDFIFDFVSNKETERILGKIDDLDIELPELV